MTNPLDKILGVLGCITEVEVKSDGDTVPRKYSLLSTLVSKEVNRISSARLAYLEEDSEEKLSEQDFFKPGKLIEIFGGSANKKKRIFKGIVIKKNLKVREQSSSILTVDCKDEVEKLTKGEESRYFYESTDSSILNEVLANYEGIDIQIEETSVKHQEMVQYHATDWDFILSRAEANCQLVFTDDGLLTTKVPKLDASEKLPVIKYGRNVYDFASQMDSRTQVRKVVAESWSPSEQEWIKVEGEVSGFEKQGDVKSKELSKVLDVKELKIKHSGELEPQELKALAEAKAMKINLARLVGRIKVDFSPLVKPGDTLILKKFGKRFDGKIYVTAIQHEINKGTGFTHIQFGLKEAEGIKNKSNGNSSTGGNLPSVQGLHIGVVTQLEKDPKLHYRVKVKLPIVDAQSEGQWARMAMQSAGKEHGFFFLPEIGDEVIIGFIDQDPRHPIVLGAMYSKANAGPFEPKNDNYQKALITKSGMKIQFDDEKKDLTISTPGGYEIRLSEESSGIFIKDQHKNTITMDKNGISLDSVGDLVLNAKKDVKINASNIQNKAKAKFKAEGSSGLDLITNAINTIKGSLVKIN